MKLQPLGDKIVLKVMEEAEATISGIFIPDSSKERPSKAEVIAVGTGEIIDGKKVELDVKVGDVVIYSKYAGSEIKLDGEELLIIRQSDVLAIIK